MEQSFGGEKEEQDCEWSFLPGEIILTDSVLGRGAFGEVRIAMWRNMEVACKSLHTIDPSQEGQLDLKTLKHEISMLSKLRHPNLVLFLGICQGLVNNTTSILTELLPCSLYDILEVNKTILELPDILDISLDISYGLDYLHKHNPQIVHRDISSKNILITGNKAKIADFGQAKLFQQHNITTNTNNNSRQTSMPGAMAYSAPEVLTGKYSSKIDIYSYGILLAQLCTNQYPRIEQREEQLETSYNKQPLLKDLIISCVQYLPHERPTTEFICQYINNIKANDRYYPLTRRTLPEKEIGILSRSYIQHEIEKYNINMMRELNQTKDLLYNEELRWKQEANKADSIMKEFMDMKGLYDMKLTEYHLLKTENNEIHEKFDENNKEKMILLTKINNLNNENIALNNKNKNNEGIINKQSNDIYEYNHKIIEYKEKNENLLYLLNNSKDNENNLIRNNEQLKKELEIQLDYNKDIELKLEQILTRWKLDKELLKNESLKYKQLNSRTSSIVTVNERLRGDIERYEARLAQYKDLPLPEELKERFQDIENDAKLAREEVSQLLQQRTEWEEAKLTLEQTIDTYKYKYDEKVLEFQTLENHLHENKEIIIKLEKERSDLNKEKEDQNNHILQLATEVDKLKETEIILNNKIKEARIALSREKSRVEMYQKAATTISISNTPTATATTSSMSDNIDINTSNNTAGNSKNTSVAPPADTATTTGAGAGPGEAHEDQTAESLYTLQKELHTQATTAVVRDLDDEDAGPAAMRCLVPSVTRQAHIQAIQSEAAQEDRTDIAIKHLVNSTADKEGVKGLISLMQEQKEDERIIWRSARSLRELILKDESTKQICYDSSIEGWIPAIAYTYQSSAVVQGHIMRLVGALAFGNDRFRRKAGEKGLMQLIAQALEIHAEDETVLLHTLTAITNLTHNSMENRSRFLEMGGTDLLVGLLIRCKESAKLIRQACWAVLSLCGTDEISRSIALRGGDSAILNAMLHHRYDAGVQQFGCWALSNLALSGEEIMRKMKKKGAVEVCRIAIETHPKNTEVLRQARNAMGAFSPLPAASSSSNVL